MLTKAKQFFLQMWCYRIGLFPHLIKVQNDELIKLIFDIEEFSNLALHIIEENKFEEINILISRRDLSSNSFSKQKKFKLRELKII